MGQNTYLELCNSSNRSVLILIIALTLTFEVDLLVTVITIIGLRWLCLPKIVSKDAELAKRGEPESSDRQTHKHTHGQDQKEPRQ